MGFVLDESGTDVANYCRKVVNGRKVSGSIRSLVNTRGLKLEYVRMLCEGLLVPALLYGSETMISRVKCRY